MLLWGYVYIGSAVAQTETNKVPWVLYSFPPYLTPESNYSRFEPAGDGPAIEFIKHAMSHMPNFQHEFEVANISRVIGLMKNGTLACNPLLLKVPERESFIEFSLPIIVALPHHIIVTEKSLDKLKPYQDQDGKVDLAKLVATPELRTSITDKRAYPAVITQAFENACDNHHNVLHSPDFNTPIKQLFAGRIDYAIAYPFEIHQYISKIGKPSGLSLNYLPISDVPEFALGRVGCTKGKRGEQIIQQINQIILEAGPRPFWNELQLDYLDNTARMRLNQLLEQYQPFGKLNNNH